ncbi:MAG: extracellular solute-binding protein [Propionibacteriaceae bacterium]
MPRRSSRPPRRHRLGFSARTLLAGGLALVLALASCGGADDDGNGGEGSGQTITLAGPNQWNSSSNSFGPAWDELLTKFTADTGITVKTTVLPVDQFAQTLSTQLAAGTAPELVFNQAPHKPELVVPLNSYLDKPNPYVEGNQRWWDLFVSEKYGPKINNSINAKGQTEFVPFNLVATGLFVNEKVLADAGVKAPITTWSQLMNGCVALREAGYTPMAMDNGFLGLSWTMQAISNMLFAKYYDQLNDYAPDGTEGKSPQLTGKDWAKAVLSKEVDATQTPEAAATIKLMKQLYDNCATKNWSGIAPSGGGAVVGLDEFAAGKAGMAWGVNFGFSALEDVDFDVSSMPFPTIEKSDSDVATGFAAQYGASTGGTSYMIPATTKGDKLTAAVSFLQWMSAPDKIQDWLNASGGIPALKDATAPKATSGFAEGAWGEQMITGSGMPAGPPAVTIQSIYEGYLLGRRSDGDQLAELQKQWVAGQKKAVEDNDWSDEPWAEGS